MKRYRVNGYCLAPMECTMVVEANTPEEAVAKALASNWKEHIDVNSSDDRAAFDWRPDAEEMPPNAPGERPPTEGDRTRP